MRTRISCALALGATGFGLLGCQQKSTTLTVCFNPPSSQAEALASSRSTQSHQSTASTASHGDNSGEDPSQVGFEEGLAPLAAESTSFVLWGDSLARQDVRDLALDLKPGDYAFLCRFVDPADDVQGTLRVHHPDDELWQTLDKWRAELPQHRRRLAFEFELQKNEARTDVGLLTSLQSQLAALDRFEHQLEKMTRGESDHRAPREETLNYLDAQNTVSMFERDATTGRAAALAAFSVEDMQRVRGARDVCRLLVVADQDEISWKKQSLDGLIRETIHLRASVRDEIARLEGRKKLRAVVFRNHEGFLRNEESLRNAKGEFARVSQRLRKLRVHMLALAVREELVVPGSGDAVAQSQARDLNAEIRISETALQRSELLFAQSVETNPGRVELRGAVERNQAELQNLHDQLALVEDVQVALRGLQQDDTPRSRVATRRVLASANITPALPQEVFQLLERDALMTVRLESRTPQRRPSEDSVAQKSGDTVRTATLANY